MNIIISRLTNRLIIRGFTSHFTTHLLSKTSGCLKAVVLSSLVAVRSFTYSVKQLHSSPSGRAATLLESRSPPLTPFLVA